MTDQPKWTPGPWRYTKAAPSGDRGVYADGTGIFAEAFADIRRAGENNATEAEANAHLIAAAPDMYAGGEAQTAIIRRAQAILTQYLIPDGLDGPEAINQLLGLLDGPDQRAAQATWDAALAKARGQA